MGVHSRFHIDNGSFSVILSTWEDNMFYQRVVENTIRNAAEQFCCITIYGARQVGKTTTVLHAFGDSIPMVSLDNSQELYLAKTNPKLFLETHTWPVIIDEIQKAPELLPFIKIIVDDHKYKWLMNNEPHRLMYILTGSNQFELQKATVESLAGRTAIIKMASLSLDEKDQNLGDSFDPDLKILKGKETLRKPRPRNRVQLFEEIFQGGMPEYVNMETDRDLFFSSYIDTYMEKDVKLLISSGAEFQFRNFLALVALRTAQEINWDDLSRNVGIDVKTCKRWISILETSGLVYMLHPYMKNASASIIKAPKLYFMDTGLCAYLCRWQDAEMLEKGVMAGAFFETFVVSEIVKSYYKVGRNPESELYYFRTMGKKEVDLLIVRNDEIYPIEIKKGIAPSNPTKNFSSLDIYKKPIKTALVIDSCDRLFPINANAWYCPVSLLSI